jgi:two-component system cell cycle response regulator DivK
MTPDLKNITIMIVDDEENNWIFMLDALRPSNASLIWARVGQEAIDIVESGEKIDVILMDMKMPIMDGYETTRAIKKINNTIPVIAQTAYAQPKEKTRCLEAGCDAYISKPIITRRLIRLITELTKKSGN